MAKKDIQEKELKKVEENVLKKIETSEAPGLEISQGEEEVIITGADTLIKEEAPISEEEKKETKEEKATKDVSSWTPKTELGRKVKKGLVTSLGEVLDKGEVILESQIVDVLLPDLESELLLVGQSKGKFGGGQRRIFKQTQKKTREGNKPSFATVAVVGNKNGFVGVGSGKSRETVPAREKAIRKAKLNILKISRGCGSWQCGCKEPHTIPFMVEGKCGSVRLILRPAPKGKGLIVESECAKILRLAGIKDVWSKSFGQTKVKTNLVNACVDALKKLITTKVRPETIEQIGIIEGSIQERG